MTLSRRSQKNETYRGIKKVTQYIYIKKNQIYKSFIIFITVF